MLHLAYFGMEFLLCLIENLVLYIYLGQCSEKRFNRWELQVLLIMATSGVVLFKDQFQLPMLQSLIIAILIVSIYSVIQFKMAWWRYIVHICIYILCIWFCDFLVTQIYSILYSRATLVYLQNYHALRYNAALISKLMVFILLVVISKREKKEDYAYSRINLFVLGITFLVTYIGLYGLDALMRFCLDYVKNENVDALMCLTSMGIFLINMIVYWAIRKLNESIEREKEYDIIQCQNEFLIKSMEENKLVENEWRKIRHDFNNHISCIDMLLQMENIEKARRYIQNLSEHFNSGELKVHIGNEVADAVINQKMLRAKSNGIHVEVDGTLSEGFNMKDIDLCALLSNGLDNAIEATCKVENQERRKINVNISSSPQFVWIKISNCVKEDIKAQGMLATTKQDTKRHGIGMRSMQATVEKYRGKLTWRCDQCIFVLDIVLPTSA